MNLVTGKDFIAYGDPFWSTEEGTIQRIENQGDYDEDAHKNFSCVFHEFNDTIITQQGMGILNGRRR